LQQEIYRLNIYPAPSGIKFAQEQDVKIGSTCLKTKTLKISHCLLWTRDIRNFWKQSKSSHQTGPL